MVSGALSCRSSIATPRPTRGPEVLRAVPRHDDVVHVELHADAGLVRHVTHRDLGLGRDLLIGVTVVTAAGSVVRGGGKVVKNVAGYDLGKLFAGSQGTLTCAALAACGITPAVLDPQPRTGTFQTPVERVERLEDFEKDVLRQIFGFGLASSSDSPSFSASARARSSSARLASRIRWIRVSRGPDSHAGGE